MSKPLEYDGKLAYELTNKLESVIIDVKPTYAEVMVSCLALAVISANNMHMSEEMFLDNCRLVFVQDKIEKLKELQ
jgi:hypothetical protein